jgi:DNA-binding NtrC family response regulator
MEQRFEPLVEYLLEGGLFLEEAIELLESALIEGALVRAGGNQSAASKALGIHRNTMKRKIAQYNLKNARPRRKPVARVTRKKISNTTAS